MAPLDGLPDHERNRALESLLAFWAGAGVDASYEDAPVDRRRTLVAPPPRQVEPPPQAAVALDGRVEASESGVAALLASVDTIAALREMVSDALGLERPVLWRGSEAPAVVVIGDTPSAEDDLAGEAFSGAAGRLLDRMLAAAGLSERALITQAVFHRPPGGRAADTDEQARTLPILERLIALAAPRVLLMLGAGAAKSVLKREEAILSLRGRWIEWRSADGRVELPALCTFSPAFLLVQQGAKRGAWADLLILSERVDRPERGG